MRHVAAALASLFICGPAAAQGTDRVFNEWSCFPLTQDALYDFEINKSRVRVNNLNIQEGVAFITKAPTLSFSATVANRAQANIAITVELVGISDGKPVFALAGDAGFGFVGPGKNEDITGTIAAAHGTLKKAQELCVRIGGFGQTE